MSSWAYNIMSKLDVAQKKNCKHEDKKQQTCSLSAGVMERQGLGYTFKRPAAQCPTAAIMYDRDVRSWKPTVARSSKNSWKSKFACENPLDLLLLAHKNVCGQHTAMPLMHYGTTEGKSHLTLQSPPTNKSTWDFSALESKRWKATLSRCG